MSNEAPPYPAPMGQKWVRSWFGLGAWTLVPDEQFPAPPTGFRYAANFWTGKLELVSVVGEGINWLDPKDTVSRPKPAVPHPTLMGTINNPRYISLTPNPEKIGKSVRSVEGLEEPLSKPLPGSDRYDVRKRDQGLFG